MRINRDLASANTVEHHSHPYCRGGFTNSFKGYQKTQKPAPTPRETPED